MIVFQLYTKNKFWNIYFVILAGRSEDTTGSLGKTTKIIVWEKTQLSNTL